MTNVNKYIFWIICVFIIIIETKGVIFVIIDIKVNANKSWAILIAIYITKFEIKIFIKHYIMLVDF